ncbi:MAG: TIGR00366 family protein [Firmicutes bacterium]|nr:TIGR00366 family protein [Bacillota bacterium]
MAKAQQSRLDRFARAAEGLVPDAITASVIFLVILFICALAMGNTVQKTMDAYYKGLWMLLAFTMQMTLIITLSSVFGSTPFFRQIILSLSRVPKSLFMVQAMGILLVAVVSYFYWGLGIALSPLVAVFFCNEAEKKGIKVDFLFTMAAFYAATSVWQYGFSSSEALLMVTPGHFLEKVTGIMPLSTTIWSPAAIIHVIAYTAILIVAARFFMPKNVVPISEYPEAHKLTEANITGEYITMSTGMGEASKKLTYSERLERFTLVSVILCIALVGWLYYHFGVQKLSLDLNSLNAIFLLLCFLFHKNVYNFTRALQEGVKSSWSVIVIYHLYAALAGIIQYTNIGGKFAGALAGISTTYTFPLLMVIAGTVIAIFVPSSGGQWVIQGFITCKAAAAVGVTYQRGMLALMVGDQMGNLTSPFWYVIVAGIARIDFRKFFGYGLIFSGIWFLLGTLIFTFLPC